MTSYQLDREKRTLTPYITGGKPEHDEAVLAAIAEKLLEVRYPPDKWEPIEVSDSQISYRSPIDVMLRTVIPISRLDVESIKRAPVIYRATIYTPLGRFIVEDGLSFTMLFGKLTELVRCIEYLETKVG